MVGFLYYLLIALTVYTDSFLTSYMGAFGFSVIPTLTYILYPILYYRKMIILPIFAKSFFKLINYAFVLSIIFCLLFYIVGIPQQLYGEYLLLKAIKLYLTFVSYVLFVIILVSLGVNLNDKQIYAPFFVIFICLTIFAYFEYKLLPHAFLSLHQSSVEGGEYWRIRLLTQESSHTAPIIEVFFFMSIYYACRIKRSWFLLLVSIACFAFQFYVSSSKSLVLIVILALVVGNFNIFVNSSVQGKLILIILVALSTYLFGGLFLRDTIENFQNDIDNFTSTATRSLTMISGYTLGLLFPFGTGFSSYLFFFPDLLKFFMEEFGRGLNLSEITTLLGAKTDHALSAQSFFAQSSSYWGILGSFYFVKKLNYVYKETLSKKNIIENIVIKTCFYCIMFNMFFISGLDFCIQAFVGIMIIRNIKRKKHYEHNLVNSRDALPSKYRR